MGDHPLLLLMPWAVFALAAGIKFWKLAGLFQRHLLGSQSSTEAFRARLERHWAAQQQRP